MPLGSRGHRGRALAGGEADHAALGRGRRCGARIVFGMGGGNGGVEERAEQGASVGHDGLHDL